MNIQSIANSAVSAYSPSTLQTQAAAQPAEASGAERSRMQDAYIPSGTMERQSAGVYRVTQSADGTRKIEFDSPAQKSEQCTTNTDKVDREIERFRQEKEQLEQQLRTVSDPQKAEQLQRQIEQTERELRQKDNDGYRRQHAVYS